MPDAYGNPTEAELRGQTNILSQPYTPATAADIRARRDAARAGEGTLDIYRGDGTSSHLTGSQLRQSADPALVQYRENMIRSGVSDPNMIFGPEKGRTVSEEEKKYRHAYHNFMRNPNKGVDHNEAIRAFGMWAAAVAAAYALPAAGATAGAEVGGAVAPGAVGGAEAGAIGAGVGGAGAGVGGATTAAELAALETITVTGTAGGLTGAQAAALGAGAAGAGGAANTLSSSYNGNQQSGWSNTSDPVGAFQNTATSNAETLANSGAIGGGAGANSGTGILGSAMQGAGGAGGVGGGSMWEDLIPLAGQLLGSWMEGEGAKDASRAQVAASMAGIAEQRRQYDTSRNDQMPWLEAGRGALGRLQDPTAFTKSPGYEFVRGEGNRDIGNSFAARGGALSGNAMRALDQYNTGLASQEYNNWFNQQASLAGVGQASAQNLAGIGQNNANNVSNLLTNQGNARASGILGQTDAYTNGLNQVGQWYGNYRRSRQGAY